MKTQRDFELWDEFCPVPIAVDLAPVHEAKRRLGEKGIIRSHPFGPGSPWSPGQGSPWQNFCTMVDTEKAIYLTYDEPDFVHHALESILQKTLRPGRPGYHPPPFTLPRLPPDVSRAAAGSQHKRVLNRGTVSWWSGGWRGTARREQIQGALRAHPHALAREAPLAPAWVPKKR